MQKQEWRKKKKKLKAQFVTFMKEMSSTLLKRAQRQTAESIKTLAPLLANDVAEIFDTHCPSSFWEEEWKQLVRSISVIDRNLHHLAIPPIREQLATAFDQFLASPEKYLQQLQKTKDAFSEENQLKNKLGIDDHAFKVLYQIGVDRFDKKKFQSAASVFSLMRYLHGFNADIWQALGLSEYYLDNFNKAIGDLFISTLFDPNDLISFIHIIQACHREDKREMAQLFFILAQERIDEHSPKKAVQALQQLEKSIIAH